MVNDQSIQVKQWLNFNLFYKYKYNVVLIKYWRFDNFFYVSYDIALIFKMWISYYSYLYKNYK